VQYFGIQVDDLAAIKKSLQSDGVEIRDGSEESRFTDPEGNQVAISQRGWAN
jgi:hypothetical protein